jgi:sugar phosphate isomerase/epimerase
LIELALTYGFKSFDVDISELLKANSSQGQEYACRFLTSAKVKVGTFDLPLRLQSDETKFKAGLVALDETASLAAAAGATRCITHVQAASDDLPYHENFELHRTRLGEIADVLGKHGVQLGIGFYAAASRRDNKKFEFIYQAEPLLTLIKTIGNQHVGLLLDTWNWQVGGGGIDQIEGLAANQIVTVRLADVPEDADLATIEERQRLVIGESETGNSAAVLRLLAEKEYSGPVSVCPHPSQFGRGTRESIVQKAARALDEQWAAAGLDRSGKVKPPEPVEVEA